MPKKYSDQNFASLKKPTPKEIDPLYHYAEDSKTVCPSCKKCCRIEKKRLQKDICYCRVSESKKAVTSRRARDKPIKNTRPKNLPKQITTSTYIPSGSKSSCKELETRQICDNQDQQVVFRSCDCHEIRKPKSEKHSCCSKLLCCSCFTHVRKQRKSKVCTAPCKQYFCPYNTARSNCNEPAVPCVKCTQNCKVAAHIEGTRRPEKKQRKIRAKTATTVAAELTTTTCSNSASESFPDNSTTGDKNQKIKWSEFTKGKPPHNQKRETSRVPPIPSRLKNHSSNYFQVPETEADGKIVPCIKNPKKVSSQALCKKLTFVSCTDLHDYKVETMVEKKRTVMGIVFDVIFWPYVFWPRGDLCR
ncbi:uncharacterized protein LOC105688152 isoform X1 [Athalia rosae]|uniref:uncharacterized protein LOC105688152 isoform X1 n=1 Tax=Athalia rosae TaxID=37344 RepID=UPI0020344861|nr:uncharacterized protein LOC105688152 isoform X1 [Athalia rosae]